MPNVNEAFPSKYLKAADLQGKEPVATMDHAVMEPVGRDRQMRLVLYFDGKEKGLILNKTVANKITEITGSALTEDWRGHRVQLYASVATFGGEEFDVVRVKAVSGQAMRMQKSAPAPAPAPVTVAADESHSGPVHDDDIPF